ncbi:MAG: iron ABC transporter substrate-binding protein [Gemmatimonadetes bacterium]|nr:iron ABC transporter substrate-binding protein [Gemmatimonadota bacterium]
MIRLRDWPVRVVLFAAVFLSLYCSRDGGEEAAGGGEKSQESLVLYCGRSQSLVDDIVAMYEESAGVDVRIKYGNTAELALAIQEEGAKSPADVFWAQDAGALGALSRKGMLQTLPPVVITRVPGMFRNTSHHWVATSGRMRVFAYSPDRVSLDDMPFSVFELAEEKWGGRVGWAPANASFQSFVTAMRVMHGEERTENWLRAMMAGGAKTYSKNTAIIEGIYAGEIDLGLPNHYYLLRFKAEDENFPVEQSSFDAGDVGNLVNIAGVGVLTSSTNAKGAQQFIEFLLSDEMQTYLVENTHEYPVIPVLHDHDGLLMYEALEELAPPIELADLEDLDGTLALLRKVGLL